MQWVAGKLTKPAFKEGFKYLQHSRPNSILTQHVAELATADNPMAPSGEDAPFDAVQGSQGGENQTGSRSLRDRAVGSIGKRAKSYALTKGLNMVWSQIMLPLTIVLWVIKLLTSFVESRQVAAALRFKSESTHASDVQRVVAQVKAMPEGRLIASKKPAAQGHMQRSNEAKKILGPASSLSSNGGVGTLHLVDLSRLNSVISLDTRAKTCRVQASCTFRNLLRVTTDSHLMPAVVPPYLDMTVGGACVGSAIGSASWKSGAFIDGVREIEVVLGSGEVLRITREGEHAALFAGLHSSYHSLGTIVAVTIDLVKAPRYLWMRYELYTSLDKATERLQSLLQVRQSEANSTLEGLVFDQKNIVLAMSQGIDVIDTQQHKVVGFGHWWEMHFYAYVQQWSQRARGRSSDMPLKHCIPLMDYLSRYEKGAFWTTAWMYHLLPWPLKGNSFVSRLIVGWTEHESNVRAAIENSSSHLAYELGRISQDAFIPLHHLGPFLHWTCDAVGVSPMWLCPVLGSESDVLAANYVHSGSSSNSADGFHYVCVGVYGRLEGLEGNAYEVNTEFLNQVYQAGGRTLLSAHNFHSSDLFAKMYDRRSYEAIRKKSGAAQGKYPSVFEKVGMSDQEREEWKQPLTEPAKEREMMQHLAIEIATRKAKFWLA